MKRDPVRVVLMWGILLIYGAPTAFAIMCWIADVKPFAWWILIWGGGATAFGVWYAEGFKARHRSDDDYADASWPPERPLGGYVDR